MNLAKVDSLFWKGKKVFLTGHTGFKGSWLSLWLSSMGADVTGYALAPNTTPNLFDASQIANEWLGESELDSFNLLTLPLWGMAFKYLQPQQVSGVKCLNTIEDHLLDGGFSSWMLESLIPYPDLITKVRHQGLDSLVAGLVATQSELHRIGGLGAFSRS